MGYSGKKQTGGLRTYFIEKPPGIFHFFILPMEIPDKTKLTPWKFHKFLLDPLEISRPKTKTLEIRLYVFLINLENSTSFLINPSRTLKIPHAISLLPLEIPYAQPPFFFFFFSNSPMQISFYLYDDNNGPDPQRFLAILVADTKLSKLTFHCAFKFCSYKLVAKLKKNLVWLRGDDILRSCINAQPIMINSLRK